MKRLQNRTKWFNRLISKIWRRKWRTEMGNREIRKWGKRTHDYHHYYFDDVKYYTGRVIWQLIKCAQFLVVSAIVMSHLWKFVRKWKRDFYESLFVVFCVTFNEESTFTSNERRLKRDVISMKVCSWFCAWRNFYETLFVVLCVTFDEEMTITTSSGKLKGNWNVTQLFTKKLS